MQGGQQSAATPTKRQALQHADDNSVDFMIFNCRSVERVGGAACAATKCNQMHAACCLLYTE